jgi:hypothetical protein
MNDGHGIRTGRDVFKVATRLELTNFNDHNVRCKCRYSLGKPSGDSNSAHATVPVLFLMFRIFTWIPGHGGWAKARTGRFVNISTANHAAHRTSIGPRICERLTVAAAADFTMVDAIIIFLLHEDASI